MHIGLIFARSSNNVIGVNNDLPWKISEDLRNFKKVTLGHTVVMGSKTWESLPESFRPLPGRKNIVLSKNSNFKINNSSVTILNSFDDVLKLEDQEVWVIGGEAIYNEAIKHASILVVTEVKATIYIDQSENSLNSYAFGPVIECKKWKLLEPKLPDLMKENGLQYERDIYVRK